MVAHTGPRSRIAQQVDLGRPRRERRIEFGQRRFELRSVMTQRLGLRVRDLELRVRDIQTCLNGLEVVEVLCVGPRRKVAQRRHLILE